MGLGYVPFKQASVKTKVFNYDFAINGGNAGFHGLNVFFPQNILVMYTTIAPITDFASANPNMSIDLTIDSGGSDFVTNSLGKTGKIADWIQVTWGFGYNNFSAASIPILMIPNSAFGPPNAAGQLGFSFNDIVTQGQYCGSITYLEIFG